MHAQEDIHDEQDEVDDDDGAGSEISGSRGHMASSSGHNMGAHTQEHIAGSSFQTVGGDSVPGSSSHEYLANLSTGLSLLLDQMDIAACQDFLDQTPLPDPYSSSAQRYPDDLSGLHHQSLTIVSPMTTGYDISSFDLLGGTPVSTFGTTHISHDLGGEDHGGDEHGGEDLGARQIRPTHCHTGGHLIKAQRNQRDH